MTESPPHRYHHGDLASALVREATAMIREGGLESLSLRKLAKRVDATPAALYHHFRDKNDLLCALAEEGFAELELRVALPSAIDDDDDLEARLVAFVRAYIAFAEANPERYDLMFGRTIWKAGTPTEALRAIAYGAFRRYLERIAALTSPRAHGADVGDDGAGADEAATSRLRVAQASWALLHGLCRLRIDGIYIDLGDLDAMSDEAARLILARVRDV